MMCPKPRPIRDQARGLMTSGPTSGAIADAVQWTLKVPTMDDEEKETQCEERSPKPFFDRPEVCRKNSMESTAAPIPEQQRSNPMRFFETARATRKPNRLDKAWGQVEVVCTPMQERATGRGPTPDELKAAAADVKAILARHFPEGPKGAARAHRQFVRWLGNWPDAEQTPGTARWSAAFRDIGGLERDPAKPNYLAEVSPVGGIDFTHISRGLDLRDRIATHAKEKIWSLLSWSTTQDGGLVLSKSGQAIARLEPDRSENAAHAGADENSYRAVTKGVDKVSTFNTMHEGKAFLENWAMGESHDTSRSAEASEKEQHEGRSLERGSRDDRSR
jgi:hypothetical protein